MKNSAKAIAKELGVQEIDVLHLVKTGEIEADDDGMLSVIEVAKHLITDRRKRKRDEPRVYFPRTTISMRFLIALENIAARKGVGIGRAAEILLLESRSFTEEYESSA